MRKSPYKIPRLLRFFEWTSLIFYRIRQAKLPSVQELFSSRRASLIFFVLGFLLILIPKITSTFSESKQETEEIPIKADSNFQSIPSVTQTPTRVIIPSLRIDLPVTIAKLTKGYWEVSATSASFGSGSATPGTVGNTVIFAHARDGLFLPLKNITFGKDIYIFTTTKWYQYRVDEIREVAPTDVYVVKKTNDERLTLFTCSGFLDLKRLIVIAKPVK